MPYIKEENRYQLDNCIENMIECLKGNVSPSASNKYSNPYKENLTNEELLSICGDINYAFSRVLSSSMGKVTYPKIAIITGVLENIKQEFYRRVAVSYENNKIQQNGDIKEYKRLN
jgi:hypothetical protein